MEINQSQCRWYDDEQQHRADALAIECRADDTDLVAALAALDDPSTRASVEAERAVLATLEAGCSAPVGALAEVVGPIWARKPSGRTNLTSRSPGADNPHRVTLVF